MGPAKVFYMSPEMESLSSFTKVLNETEYDVIYLNGFFSQIYTIRPLLLRKLGKLKKATVILTPRGDFTGGLETKKLKKYAYITVIKLFGIYSNLLWHATSEIEECSIKKIFPRARTFMVPNLPEKFIEKKTIIRKEPGKLRLVFVSRISPKKNIKYALKVLKQITEGDIVFDIYGPMEDKTYWAECEKLIALMPKNIIIRYCGEVPHEEVPNVFEQYHAFFFPTLGENYGHAIVESMMNNCLCILSKGVTPWDEYIEKLNIGAFLNDKVKFVEIIKRLVAADQDEISRMLIYNNKFIARKTNFEKDIKKYIQLFSS